MAGMRKKYAHAGPEYRMKLIDQTVELLSSHRKSAIRALSKKPQPKPQAPYVKTGRPREYHSDTLMPPLKAIWFATNQPCGSRLKPMLAEWVPAYESDHHRLDKDVRRALLSVSARTLDRILAPLRASDGKRSATTRPGTMLRQTISCATFTSEKSPSSSLVHDPTTRTTTPTSNNATPRTSARNLGTSTTITPPSSRSSTPSAKANCGNSTTTF